MPSLYAQAIVEGKMFLCILIPALIPDGQFANQRPAAREVSGLSSELAAVIPWLLRNHRFAVCPCRAIQRSSGALVRPSRKNPKCKVVKEESGFGKESGMGNRGDQRMVSVEGTTNALPPTPKERPCHGGRKQFP